MRLNWLPNILAIKSVPVPPDHYVVNENFAETVRSSLATGSVSMRTGSLFTKEDHDRLYNEIKNYRFTD